jgi:hypothetical protein
LSYPAEVEPLGPEATVGVALCRGERIANSAPGASG